MENKSEIAQLRQRIEEEYTAAHRALYELAMTGRHEFITARMEGLQNAHKKLQTIVGEEEGTRMMAETLEGIGGTEKSEPL